jgi:glyceraldehyde 3-phosphate dehydrogenase
MVRRNLMINGAGGRIGRTIVYEFFRQKTKETGVENLELIALNDVLGIDYVVKSFQARDAVHGKYDWQVEKSGNDKLRITKLGENPLSREVVVYSEKDPFILPLNVCGAEVVLECSGRFGDPEKKDMKLGYCESRARAFLRGNVKKVIQTYPATTSDVSLIMGVNLDIYDNQKHNVISNASCTTKAIAMPLQVLLDNGIEIDSMAMVTTHAATATQGVLDSIGQIATHSTGATKALGLVIPSLNGKMNGMAYRVPTLDGSFANLYITAFSNKELDAEKINTMMKKAVEEKKYESRIGLIESKAAGTFDIIGRRENSVVVTGLTELIENKSFANGKKSYLITLVAGYDNELGPSVDAVALSNYVAGKM